MNLTLEAYILSDLPYHCLIFCYILWQLFSFMLALLMCPILHWLLLLTVTIAMPMFNILLHSVGVVLVSLSHLHLHFVHATPIFLLSAACTSLLHFIHATPIVLYSLY